MKSAVIRLQFHSRYFHSENRIYWDNWKFNFLPTIIPIPFHCWMVLAGKYWGNCVPTAFPENKFSERREKIVYTKRLFKEKFGPCLSEIGHVCEPWLDAGFFKKLHKSFLGYLRKLEYGLDIDDTMEYLLSVIMLLHIYRKISLLLKEVHDELFSWSKYYT